MIPAQFYFAGKVKLEFKTHRSRKDLESSLSHLTTLSFAFLSQKLSRLMWPGPKVTDEVNLHRIYNRRSERTTDWHKGGKSKHCRLRPEGWHHFYTARILIARIIRKEFDRFIQNNSCSFEENLKERLRKEEGLKLILHGQNYVAPFFGQSRSERFRPNLINPAV